MGNGTNIMTIRFDNPLRMVRELKGAPLSILWVLFYAQQRVSQEFLERSTGYSDKPVSQALAYLEEIGLVNHTRSGWALIQDNQNQLPLPLALEGGPGRAAPEPRELALEEPAVQADPENKDPESGVSRNNSDSLITTTLINNDLIDSVVVISNNAENRRNSDFEANLEEFKQQGIGRNPRTEALARMNHVNPGYICAHLKSLKKKDSKGLAIMRMEQGEDPPKTSIELTDAEKRAKYGEWEQ